MLSALETEYTFEQRRIMNRPKSGATRSIEKILAPVDLKSADHPHLKSAPLGGASAGAGNCVLPRYIFTGPAGGGDSIRIALFAGVHGDQPEGTFALVRLLLILADQPAWASGYTLHFYPVCNPSGFERNTRLSASGHDLNTEFWNQTNEPEVLLLQREILSQFFHGLITLETDSTSQGVYGSVRGAALTKHLLKPALEAAGQLLPRNQSDQIAGHPARNGIIQQSATGGLGAPPNARPKPFEITLASPKTAPESVKEGAVVLALRSILDEYRQFISYAANL